MKKTILSGACTLLAGYGAAIPLAFLKDYADVAYPPPSAVGFLVFLSFIVVPTLIGVSGAFITAHTAQKELFE